MKTLFSMLAMVLFVSFSGAQQSNTEVDINEQKSPPIEISWDETVHEFGDIPAATPATARFEFTNKDNEPLTITKVKSSCGCTVANYSKNPILPGQQGFVSATYNAVKPGKFHKVVTVRLNDNSTHRLTVKGTVVKLEEVTAGEAGS